MEGFLPIFFLAVILKIPVGLMLYLVWWAFRAEPDLEEAPPDTGEDRFHRWRREPRHPHGPRRGPHGAPDAKPLPECPPGGRTRVLTPPVPARATASHTRGASESV